MIAVNEATPYFRFRRVCRVCTRAFFSFTAAPDGRRSFFPGVYITFRRAADERDYARRKWTLTRAAHLLHAFAARVFLDRCFGFTGVRLGRRHSSGDRRSERQQLLFLSSSEALFLTFLQTLYFITCVHHLL